MKNLFFISLLMISIVSCGNSKEQKEKKQAAELEAAAKEVMDIHDEVMPKTGEIFKLKKKLLSIENFVNDSASISKIYLLVEALEKADKSMMDWMHNYREPDPYLSHDEKISYYMEEKKKIMQVKKDIEVSIENAKNETKKYIE